MNNKFMVTGIRLRRIEVEDIEDIEIWEADVADNITGEVGKAIVLAKEIFSKDCDILFSKNLSYINDKNDKKVIIKEMLKAIIEILV